MSDAATPAETPPSGKRRLPVILGLFLALAGGGAGFYAARTGLLPLDRGATHAHGAAESKARADFAFVALEPLMISLNGVGGLDHLRFRAQLEVDADHRDEVESLLPRVVDVMNGYLRALEVADFQDPLALTRLRSQLLRRIQVVAGPERVRDLLIMDFVLN